MGNSFTLLHASTVDPVTYMPGPEECVEAMPYEPMDMGYSPAFFEDYSPGRAGELFLDEVVPFVKKV